MKIISLLNQKGGVAKSTSAVNLSTALSLMDKKVLLIDFDPQGDSTDSSGIIEEQEKTTLEFLLNGEDSRVETKHYDVIPSDVSLAGFDLTVASKIARESILKINLKQFEDEYDYVLIDCQPSLSLLPINALVASDLIIVPMMAEKYSTKGINALLNTIEEIKPLNSNLDYKFLITRFNKSFSHNIMLEGEIRDVIGDLTLDTIIRQDVKISNSQLESTNIFDYDKRSKAANDYMKLAEEVEKLG